jgi:hypothetical protein
MGERAAAGAPRRPTGAAVHRDREPADPRPHLNPARWQSGGVGAVQALDDGRPAHGPSSPSGTLTRPPFGRVPARPPARPRSGHAQHPHRPGGPPHQGPFRRSAYPHVASQRNLERRPVMTTITQTRRTGPTTSPSNSPATPSAPANASSKASASSASSGSLTTRGPARAATTSSSANSSRWPSSRRSSPTTSSKRRRGMRSRPPGRAA